MPRRANGEGMIIQRKDGRWQASLVVGVKRRYVYGKTRKEAAAKLQALKTGWLGGVVVEPTKMSVADYFEGWRERAKPNLRESTIYLYDLLLRIHVLPVLEHLKLKDVAPLHIAEIKRRIQERGCSPRTVEQVLRLLNKAFGDAVKLRLLAQNPAKDIDIPTSEPKRVKLWNNDQVEAFVTETLEGLTQVDTPYDALWLFLLGSGCRIGEAMGLRVEDVDWDDSLIMIERSISMVGNQPVLSTPKTVAGIRTIKLSDSAMRALRVQALRAHPETIPNPSGHGQQTVHYFFRNRNGKVPHPSDLRKRFMEACKRAGVPPMRIHGLRHLHASLAVKAGADVKTVQKQLGHASLAMTLQVYAEAREGGSQIIADALSQFGRPKLKVV